MPKETAVVICNWNKADDLKKCMESVQRSNYQNFDLIVVDNASTDNSLVMLQGSTIEHHLISLPENIGGAGGFNAGMEYALLGSYHYIVLLDNDVTIESDTLGSLVDSMNANENLGLLGAQLMMAGAQNRLQEFGSYVDWELYNINPKNKGSHDVTTLLEYLECDYVPACALIAKASMVRKVGLMDAQYFIYWDDIDWGYRIKCAGYKVMVTSKAKAYHKMGASERKTTFATYYFWRNRIHFFLKYTEQNQLDQFVTRLFDDLHRAIYFSKFNNRWSVVKSIIYAFEDALDNIRGKAKLDRIFEIEKINDKLNEWINNQSIGNLIIENYGSDLSVYQKVNDKLLEVGKFQIIEKEVGNDDSNYHICISNHILDMGSEVMNYKYDLFIDSFNNIVYTREEREDINDYHRSIQSSEKWMLDYIKSRVIRLGRG